MFSVNKNNYKEKMINTFSKLAVNKQLSSLRDGFSFITPLLIVGAIGVLFIVFVFGGWGSNNASLLGLIARIDASVNGATAAGVTFDKEGILTFAENSVYSKISTIGVTIFGPLWSGTVGDALSIYTAFTIGYFYSRTKNTNQPIIAGLLSVTTFFIVTGFDASLFGTKGSLISIISTFVTIEVYSKLEKNPKLQLKMPDGVPPAVSASFSKLFPLIIVASGLALINAPFVILNVLVGIESKSLGHAIYIALQSPFVSLASDPNGQLGIGLLFVFLVGFFWFFGLHGSNILDGAVNPIWFILLAMNVESQASGQVPVQAMAKGFWDAYVYIGGSGATLGLLIATLIFTKRKDTKEITKFSLPAGLFQINEPVTFGYPMVLNTTFFIPYVLLMPVLTIISWLAISVLKWVPGGIVAIPWSTPIILGAFLHGGSWQGALLALLNFTISVLVYIPFVLIYNNKIEKGAREVSIAERIVKFTKIKKEKLELKEKIKASNESTYNEYISLNEKLVGLSKANKDFRKEKISKLKAEMELEINNLFTAFDEKYCEINKIIKTGYECSLEEYSDIQSKIDNVVNDFKKKIDAEFANGNISKFERKKNVAMLKEEMYYNINTIKNGKIVDQSTIDSYFDKLNTLSSELEQGIISIKSKFDSQIKIIKKMNIEEYITTVEKINQIELGVKNGTK